MAFFHGIGTQYFRTKNRREAAIAGIKVPFQDVRRVWPLMTHIFAVNLGGDLFRRRAENQIVILENDTDMPFITGDQPIINLVPRQKDGSPSERIELLLSAIANQSHAARRGYDSTSDLAAPRSGDQLQRPDRFTFIRPDLRQFRGITGFRLLTRSKGEILILVTLDRHHADIAQGILALAVALHSNRG